MMLAVSLGDSASAQEVAGEGSGAPAAEPAAPPAQVELVAGGSFDAPATEWNGLPLSNGQLCVDVPGGTVNPWDVAVSQPGVPIVAGETYELSFDASSLPRSVTVRALVQLPATPFTTALDRNPVLTGTSQHFSYTFRATTSMTAAVSLQIGGASQPWSMCLDNFSLQSGAVLQPYVPQTGPRVRVNQLGYLPVGPKRATLVSSVSTPLPFRVLDAQGAARFSGQSVPRGCRSSSSIACTSWGAATGWR
jgi:endoglucanase